MNRAAHRTVLVGCACILFAVAATAGEKRYLKRNELFCDVADQICIRGSLTYDKNPRLLWLRGRVNKPADAGLLRIRLAGKNDLGHPKTAPMEIKLRGTYSEIINFKMIPDHPDVENWEVTIIEYVPENGTTTKQ